MLLTDVTLPSPLPAWERLAAACIREPEARARLLELSVSVPRRTPRAGPGPSSSWAHVAELNCGVTAQGPRADGQRSGRKDRDVSVLAVNHFRSGSRGPGRQPPSCRET